MPATVLDTTQKNVKRLVSLLVSWYFQFAVCGILSESESSWFSKVIRRI